jgi:pyruvyl transferase EpsO
MHHDPATLDLIRHLRQEILSILDPMMSGVTRCALVAFPNHNNSGDNAIWLGELAYLKRAGVIPAYVCDHRNYDMRDLRRRLPDGPILIHGGGNFGDLWPQQQAFRERVLEDFADRSFIQLPQTVTFVRRQVPDRMRRLEEVRNGRLVVLCRDRTSEAQVMEGTGLAARLCPDMAVMLGPLEAPVTSTADIVVIARRDHERQFEDIRFRPELRVIRTDWLDAGRHPLKRRLTVRTRTSVSSIAEKSRGDGMIHSGVRAVPTRFHAALARRRTMEGVRLLSTGRVVVTDRLHGHILSLLLGTPHVLLGDKYGKLERFHRDFTAHSPLTHMASSPQEASQIASELAVEARSQRAGQRA